MQSTITVIKALKGFGFEFSEPITSFVLSSGLVSILLQIIGRECVFYFHDMIVEMIKWGFEEGKTLFGFGYDFRQSNRLPETLESFAKKLELVYKASGGKKINIISHSMGGLLVKCFMSLHSDIFEKYVKNWIAIAAPFRGAPGYIASTFLNGMSFVEGWEQNFFISKWSMHQLLIECPSIYELMACPHFKWQHIPLLEIWKEKQDSDGNSQIILESYPPKESINVFKDALSSNTVNYEGEDVPLPFNVEILKWANETHRLLSSSKVPSQVKFYNIYGINLETPHSVCYGSEEAPVTDVQELRFFQPTYVCVDGDGTVPAESAKADGLSAEARVGIPGEHRGILSDHHLFRILKHWLKAGDPDPYYNPINDYVILPTAFEIETHKEKGVQVTSLKEEWEIISGDKDEIDNMADRSPVVSSISVSHGGDGKSQREKAYATVVVHPQNEGKQHIQLSAVGLSVDS
ncbi:lecithin-cholesterol acyltransferase-like 4 isoform X3 [Ricinus communis]|uniref:lecithin-cholesterol acyltransferase-like 4 isoform X3 n=1 Tax=Ricinus communis TaxID=3988 RepID=UPI000D6984DB|nr:lecithin-cholesterol acyltransferase-like 4 isoform X3 [Ricinus communis]|eukprot:XP_025014007.1 lecithin-cholesterol acyltransferase-like 4 isoform X2 [Ricinus communis]